MGNPLYQLSEVAAEHRPQPIEILKEEGTIQAPLTLDLGYEFWRGVVPAWR